MKSSVLSFPRLPKLVILFFLIAACSEQADIRINEQKFIDLYAHLLIMDEIRDDSMRVIIQREFLLREGISSGQIDSTVTYYKRNPEVWPEVMRQIRDRIKELRAHPITIDSLRTG